MAPFRAALVYFVMVFAAGLLLGPLRELVVKPWAGGLVAVCLEAPLMIAVMIYAAPRAARWAGLGQDSGWASRAIMGTTALVLVLATEFVAAFALRGWSWTTWIGHFATPEGNVGMGLYVVFALVPLFSRAIAKERVP